VNPDPFTLRELVWMAESKQKEAWSHTSSIMALTANCHRDPKKTRRFRPDDFNPFAARRRQGIPLTADNVGLLKRFARKEKES